jgi:hypothetical protein
LGWPRHLVDGPRRTASRQSRTRWNDCDADRERQALVESGAAADREIVEANRPSDQDPPARKRKKGRGLRGPRPFFDISQLSSSSDSLQLRAGDRDVRPREPIEREHVREAIEHQGPRLKLVCGRARVRRCRRPLRGSYSFVVKQSWVMPRFLAVAARLCPPFGRAQIRRLTRDNRLPTVVHTARYVPHPSMCPRCAQHLARVYLRAFVGGQALVRPDELCSTCQVRLQEFARCHRREVA